MTERARPATLLLPVLVAFPACAARRKRRLKLRPACSVVCGFTRILKRALEERPGYVGVTCALLSGVN